jgi:hypothetical protein
MDRMITLERCRKVLGPKNGLSDETLATLREQLYCFAELALNVRDRQETTDSEPFAFEQAAKSPEELEALRERAAIIEFDGNFSRDDAERLAITLSLENERLN